MDVLGAVLDVVLLLYCCCCTAVGHFVILALADLEEAHFL